MTVTETRADASTKWTDESPEQSKFSLCVYCVNKEIKRSNRFMGLCSKCFMPYTKLFRDRKHVAYVFSFYFFYFFIFFYFFWLFVFLSFFFTEELFWSLLSRSNSLSYRILSNHDFLCQDFACTSSSCIAYSNKQIALYEARHCSNWSIK